MSSEDDGRVVVDDDGDALEMVDIRHARDAEAVDVRELAAYGTPLGTLRAIACLEKFTQLRRLRIHGCGLKAMDVHALTHCVDLEELNLSSNDIERVEGLRGLKNLKSLNLASNAITCAVGLREAPTSLEKVNLANNRISSLHGLCRDDGLEWGIRVLDVRGNDIARFQELRALAELTRLESLRLRTTDDGSVIGEETNTVCNVGSYRLTIASLVPWLNHLDGVVVSIETSTKAMTKTLEKNGSKRLEDDGGRMTPPIAEHISRTPKKSEHAALSDSVFSVSGESGTSEKAPVDRGEPPTQVDRDDGVTRVRDEGCQTDAPFEPKNLEAETQTDEVQDILSITLSDVEVLRQDLSSTQKALEMSSDAEHVANRRIDELQSTLRDVRQESAENLAQLKNMYADEHKSIAQRQALESNRVSAENEQLLSENERLMARVATLEAELSSTSESLTQNLESANIELADLRTKYSELTHAFEESEILNEELAQVIESQRGHLTDFAKTRELVKLLEAELSLVKKSVDDREDAHKTIESAKCAAEEAEKAARRREAKARDRELVAEKLIRDVEALQARLEAANENKHIRDDVIQHQNQLIKSLKQEAIRAHEEKNLSLTDMETKASQSDAKTRALVAECQSLMEQVEALEMNASELESALAEAQIDRGSYEHALRNARDSIDERDTMIERMQTQLARVTDTLDTRDRIESARAAELEDQVHELQYQLDIAREDARTCESKIAAIREESDADVREAYERVDDVENEMRALLLEMAEERRANRERLDRIGYLLNITPSKADGW